MPKTIITKPIDAQNGPKQIPEECRMGKWVEATSSGKTGGIKRNGFDFNLNNGLCAAC